MSLILDALRKSDRQRSRRATEQLRWGPGPAGHGASRPRLTIIALLLIIIALTVAASAWLGTRLASTSGSQQQEMADEPPQRPAVRALKNELATSKTRPADTAVVTDISPLADGGETSATLTDDDGQGFDDILAAPGLSEMPADYRIRVPQLEINVHAWTEEPSARFVLINMRRYSEGERLQEGPLLRQITPEGVVLEYENELFTLPQR